MFTTTEEILATLIDCDNASPSYIAIILNLADLSLSNNATELIDSTFVPYCFSTVLLLQTSTSPGTTCKLGSYYIGKIALLVSFFIVTQSLSCLCVVEFALKNNICSLFNMQFDYISIN